MRFGFVGRLVKNLGRSPQWPAVRAAHLKKQPFCQGCGGTKELEVHHLMPFHLNPSRELDDANLLTLCELASHECHYRIGHLLDWKAYNPAAIEDAAAYLVKVKNRPYS